MSGAAWLDEALRGLLAASAAGALLVALVLAAQAAFRRRLTPRWRYALWLLVVARLLLPVAPPSRASLFNFCSHWKFPPSRHGIAPLSPGRSAPAEPGRRDAGQRLEFPRVGTFGQAAAPAAGPEADAGPPAAPPARSLSWHGVLFAVWLAVASALLVRLALGNLRLSARVCRQRAVTRQDALDVLEDVKDELRVHVPIGVVESDRVASPALLGFIRPRLLLPPRMLESFGRDELRLVFLHELAHVKRWDIAASWLMSVACALHWFNPLAWLAYHRMRADRELACDSLVLSFGRERENERYGRTMLKVLERAAPPTLVPGVAGLLEDRGALRRRMTMIAEHRGHRYQGSMLAAGLMLLLGAVTFTSAVRESGAEDAAGLAAATQHLNLDFEQGAMPGGASAAAWGGGGDGYEFAVDAAIKHGGAFAGRIRNLRPGADGFGTYTTFLDPAAAAGRRVRLSGFLKLDGVTGYAGLWMRADQGGQPVAFDNMMQRQVRGTRDWQPHSIEIDVPAGTDNINFGALIAGGGTLWVDDLKIEAVGDARAQAATPPAGADERFDFAPAIRDLDAWLALADGGSSDATYDGASAYFREAVDRESWAQAFRAARPPLGRLISRTLSTRQHEQALPGAPDGEYVVILYQTQFEKKRSAVETCTLVKEPDGRWRVAGYFIR